MVFHTLCTRWYYCLAIGIVLSDFISLMYNDVGHFHPSRLCKSEKYPIGNTKDMEAFIGITREEHWGKGNGDF